MDITCDRCLIGRLTLGNKSAKKQYPSEMSTVGKSNSGRTPSTESRREGEKSRDFINAIVISNGIFIRVPELIDGFQF